MQQVLQGLRPYSAGDIRSLAELLRVADAWPPPFPPTPEDLLSRWKHWDLDPEHDINVLPRSDGTLIAFCQTALSRRDLRRVSLEMAVHPDRRREGIGAALYNLTEVRARELRADHISSPIFMSPGLDKDASISFLAQRGFRRSSAYWRMRLDHIGRIGPPSWPAGIGCRVFNNSRQDAEKWASLVTAAFAEPASADMILSQVAEPESSPDGYFFAVDSSTGREIGTSRARFETLGGQQWGYIGTVGVLPDYRGRGIADALMRQTLQYISNHGRQTATLFVEDSNKPARALYDKMGWHPVYRTDHYWKMVSHLVSEPGT